MTSDLIMLILIQQLSKAKNIPRSGNVRIGVAKKPGIKLPRNMFYEQVSWTRFNKKSFKCIVNRTYSYDFETNTIFTKCATSILISIVQHINQNSVLSSSQISDGKAQSFAHGKHSKLLPANTEKLPTNRPQDRKVLWLHMNYSTKLFLRVKIWTIQRDLQGQKGFSMKIQIIAMICSSAATRQVEVLKSGSKFAPDQHNVVCITKFQGKFVYIDSEGRPGETSTAESSSEVW